MNNSKDAGFNTLVLDAGNLFFKQNKIDPGISLDVAKENAYTIVEAFNHISCDAFSPGVKDFAAGLDFLNILSSKSEFDYISCNIKNEDNGLIFKPYKIIDQDGFNFGIIGVSSYFESDEVVIDDPYESINKVISEIESKCDCIVLLFNASDSDYKKLFQSDLAVDLIIRGNTRKKSISGGKNSTPVYSTGDRGRALYQFDLKYSNDIDPLLDVAYFEKEIKSNTKRMNQLIQNSGDEDKIKEYKNNIEGYNDAIDNIKNSLQFKKIDLNKTVQDNPHVLKIVDEGKIRTQTMGSPMIDPHQFHNH